MRYGLVLTTVFIAAGIGLGAASAAPAPRVAGLVAPHGSFERAGWRRNYGYPYAAPPVVVVPQAAPPPVVVQQQPVVVQSSRWWSSNRSWSCRRARRAAANIATGTASTASMRATTGRISDRGRNRISAQLRRVLEVILDLLDEQAPGLMLARACGFLHRDLQIAELALDLLARQHMQAARQDRGLDHRSLGAVEALKRRM
jgi:hypothetical protein